MKTTYRNTRLLTTLTGLSLALIVQAQQGLQYWFDSYKDPKTIGMSATNGTLKTSIDAQQLPTGFHTLYMRLVDGNSYSPVTSAYFFKFASAGESKLEYWFDDAIDKRASIPIDAKSDILQLTELDLSDVKRFPMGVHRLNIRLAAHGTHYSPIYTDNVLRLPTGGHRFLTYWLDDDYAHRVRVRATTSNGKDAYFKARLNLSSASTGMHRLYYCVSSTDIEHSAIYEMPILITQLYNSQTNITIQNHSSWVDDKAPFTQSASHPSELFTQVYSLDPANFDNGQHAFHVQYKNSVGVWSGQNITYFYKEPVTGRLRAGMIPPDINGIQDMSQEEFFSCSYRNGTLFVDCLSSRLDQTATVFVSDLSGRVIVRQKVDNKDGIHATIAAEGLDNQLLIVRLTSGKVHFTRKLMTK